MAGSNQRLFVQAALETREETQAALVALAKREHRRVMQDDPRPSRFVRTVDGARGAREEQVRPDGTIIYVYPRLDEVVQAAMDLLFELSPVLSGAYRMGHTLFVDGVEARNLEAWSGQGQILISNVLPYSRKIELGKMTMRVPGSEHVYEQAEFTLQQRFGNQARIFFTYRGLMGGSVLTSKQGGNKSEYRYPALEIRER
ncbi:hypothetical protein [Devosia sp. Root635]|uniref:hypothetical protein n=1 Tax=Devosia sp. Root635 TaxID=1736575 RepID=UPI000700E458|nr:hypothetical protein [Devosia sp. Root635]KRA42096.1 hypothetical protein ASD80_10235 [Devosia sp. Root635]